MVITMRDMACFNYTLRVCESATYAATTIAWQVGGAEAWTPVAPDRPGLMTITTAARTRRGLSPDACV
jgi:hypothetical protein